VFGNSLQLMASADMIDVLASIPRHHGDSDPLSMLAVQNASSRLEAASIGLRIGAEPLVTRLTAIGHACRRPSSLIQCDVDQSRALDPHRTMEQGAVPKRRRQLAALFTALGTGRPS
jgi:hypothetical protein